MVYSYITQDEEPLELEEGDPVVFIKEEGEGWAEVSVTDGRRKYVPKNYLKLSDEQVEPETPVENGDYEYCHAVYDYLDGGAHDLKFNKGDLITVIEKNEDGWYVGQLENGDKGYFPTNYTDMWSSVKNNNGEAGDGSSVSQQYPVVGDWENDNDGADENYDDPGSALSQQGRDTPFSRSSHNPPYRQNAKPQGSGYSRNQDGGESEELPKPPTKKKHGKMRKISLLDGVGKPSNDNNNNLQKQKRIEILKDLRRKAQKKRRRSGSRTPTVDPPSRPHPKRIMHDRRSKSAIPAVAMGKFNIIDDDERRSSPSSKKKRKKNISEEQQRKLQQRQQPTPPPNAEELRKRKKKKKKERREQRRRASEQLRNLDIMGEEEDEDGNKKKGGFGGRKRRSGSRGMLVDVLEIPNREIKKCRNEKGEIVVIGEGSFGKVFMCLWHRGTLYEPVEVAVKVVPLKVARETLEKEVLTVKLLNHPSVVNVFGFSYLSRRKFGIVMEYIDGGTLFDLAQGNFKNFENKEPLSLYDKWSACRKMTEAVRFLHSRRVIHRDIKSLNFLVTRDRERIKICDFGLAKIKTESKTVDLKTGLKGTVRYMAPELSEESPKYGIKSDIFALGMCFFEVCTGKIPFENQMNEIQVLMLIMKGVVPALPPDIFVPDELKCLIEICLKKDPEERPTTEDILKFMKDRDEIFIRNYPPPKKKKNSSSASSSGGSKVNEISDQFVRDFEDVFKCPIGGEIMEDPYLLVESGISYEREAIEGYLKKNNTDPLTGKKLKTKLVVPNITLKKTIEMWNERND